MSMLTPIAKFAACAGQSERVHQELAAAAPGRITAEPDL